MRRSHLQCGGLLLCALIVAGHTSEAAAQFGKLKKAAGQKAAEEAAGKAAESTTGSACIPARPPIMVEAVPLTAAQMAKINAGLDAEIAAAATAKQEADKQDKEFQERQKAYDKAYAEYDKRNGPWNECARKVSDEDVAKSDAMNRNASGQGDAIMGGMSQEDLEKLAERAQAAAQRVSEGKGTAEDRKTLAEYQQVMAGIQGRAGAAIAAQQETQKYQQGSDARVEAKCGKRPVAPEQPAQAQSTWDVVSAAGAKAAGVPASTWRQWREDQLALATSNTVVKADKGGEKDGKDGASGGNDAATMNQQIKATAQKICAMKKAGVPM